MDYSSQILEALQEKLDVGIAYPVVYTMTPQTIDMFVGSVFTRLHNKIEEIMNNVGEKYVSNNDSLGLSILLIRNGIKLPTDMILEICEHIINSSRRVARWIAPANSGNGNLWYCKMYLNI